MSHSISQVAGPHAPLTHKSLLREQISMLEQGRPTQEYLFRVDNELEYWQVLWCPYNDGSGKGDAGVAWRGKLVWRDSFSPYEAVVAICAQWSKGRRV